MTWISGIFLSVEALDVVGPRLSKECRERDLSVTDKAAAEIFVARSLKVSHTKNVIFILLLCQICFNLCIYFLYLVVVHSRVEMATTMRCREL